MIQSKKSKSCVRPENVAWDHERFLNIYTFCQEGDVYRHRKILYTLEDLHKIYIYMYVYLPGFLKTMLLGWSLWSGALQLSRLYEYFFFLFHSLFSFSFLFRVCF